MCAYCVGMAYIKCSPQLICRKWKKARKPWKWNALDLKGNFNLTIVFNKPEYWWLTGTKLYLYKWILPFSMDSLIRTEMHLILLKNARACRTKTELHYDNGGTVSSIEFFENVTVSDCTRLCIMFFKNFSRWWYQGCVINDKWWIVNIWLDTFNLIQDKVKTDDKCKFKENPLTILKNMSFLLLALRLTSKIVPNEIKISITMVRFTFLVLDYMCVHSVHSKQCI